MKARIKATNEIVEVLFAEVYASGEYKAFYLNIPKPLNKFKPDEIELIDDYMIDYEKKYKNLVEAVKVLQETNPSDEGIQNWVKDNVPELTESEGFKKQVEQNTNKDLPSFDESQGTPILKQGEQKNAFSGYLKNYQKKINDMI